MVFFIILSAFAIVLAIVFAVKWSKEKEQNRVNQVKRHYEDKAKEAQIGEFNRTLSSLSQSIKEKEELLQERTEEYEDGVIRVYEIGVACKALEEKFHSNSLSLSDLQAEKEKLLTEQKELEKRIELLKPHLQELSQELDQLKSIKRSALLDSVNTEELLKLWDLGSSISDKENELISILNRIKKDYPELTIDIATIEWRKIWLPRLQELGSREGLNCRGIYRLVLKSDDKVCYVGQAVNIQDRWYQHVKKMIGADSKGGEKLYKYRPEDFYWTVIEKGDGIDLNKSEHYWIDYYCCKEIGLNRKA